MERERVTRRSASNALSEVCFSRVLITLRTRPPLPRGFFIHPIPGPVPRNRHSCSRKSSFHSQDLRRCVGLAPLSATYRLSSMIVAIVARRSEWARTPSSEPRKFRITQNPALLGENRVRHARTPSRISGVCSAATLCSAEYLRSKK